MIFETKNRKKQAGGGKNLPAGGGHYAPQANFFEHFQLHSKILNVLRVISERENTEKWKQTLKFRPAGQTLSCHLSGSRQIIGGVKYLPK